MSIFLRHLNLKLFFLSFLCFSFFTEINAQVPSVVRELTGTSNTTFGLGTTSSKKTQLMYLPGELTGTVFNGDINKIYFQYHTTTEQSFTDLVIRIGQTTNTSYETTSFLTGLNEVFSGALTIPAGVAGDWFAINLQSVFQGYDPTQSLVIETVWNTNPTSTTWAVRTGASDPASTNRKIYTSNPDAVVGTRTTSRQNFGFDLIPSSNMVYDSSKATQNNTSFVIAGRQNEEIIGLEIFTNGSLLPLNVTSVTFNTNGTTNVADISAAKVFYTGSSTVFNTTNQFGSTVSAPSGTFTVTGTQELNPGKNHFWLAYDISSTAVLNNTVDAEATSLTVGGVVYSPTVTNPGPGRNIEGALSGDYYIGTSMFRMLSGLDIQFEKTEQSVERTYLTTNHNEYPELLEHDDLTAEIRDGKVFESSSKPRPELQYEEITVTRTFDEVVYTPLLNSRAYEGSLYYDLTPSDKENYNLGKIRGVFATITAAVAELNNKGVSGPVRFILTDATYPAETFPITLQEFGGASETSKVTIMPGTGVTVTISALASGIPLFNLNGSSYFVIDGRQMGEGSVKSMTLENLANTANSAVIRFINGAKYNTIQYCNLKAVNSTSTTRGVDITTSTAESGNSFNTVADCNIEGSRYAVYFSGTAGKPNSDNTIIRNNISNFDFVGIWLSNNTDNTLMESNNIFMNIVGSSTANSAINISTNILGTTNILKNKIWDIQNTATSTVRGITMSPSAGSVFNIINNFVALTSDNGTKTSIYGVATGGTAAYTLNYYFNTTYSGGNHTGGTVNVIVSSGFYRPTSDTNSTINVKNNINVNRRTGGTAGVFHTASMYFGTGGIVDVDYNAYYSQPGEGAYHAGWGTLIYNVLSGYKAATAPQEQNSVFKNVHFVSPIDLHLADSSWADWDLAAIPISGITDDIDGNPRNNLFPYKGADEAEMPIPVELTSFTANVTSGSVTLNWTTSTETNNSGFTVERRNESENYIQLGFVKGNGSTTEISSYTFTDNSISAGKYIYRLKQSDYDGSYTYSKEIEVDVTIPSVFSLEQNYPNPFNPATVIKFAIPEDQFVSLTVYNSLGEKVGMLVSETMKAGRYEVSFNASRLSSGVYFYRIEAGNFVSVKKMMIMK
jgi:hypothetical protein